MTPSQHEEIRQMLSAYLDGELTQGEAQRVEVHLEDCESCRRSLGDLARLQELTRELAFAEPPEARMKELEKSLSVQAPRRLGWVFVVAGAVAWLAYGAVTYVRHWRPPTVEELLASAVVTGFVLLLVSVVVERLRQLPHDKYRRIEK
jgi:anti-sigma factor RsiW